MIGILLTLVFGQPAQAAAAPPAPPLPVRYVAATGHTLRPPFLGFYDAHGGAAIFGPPLTEVVAQDGIAVQYFTHARFEWHDDHIVLASLGRVFAAGKTESPPFAWQAASPDPERTLVGESGHTIGGAFGWFWQNNGGVAVFGYPISEEFSEDGQLVQYFERARLAYDAASATVTRAPLGQWLLDQQPQAAAWAAPVPPITALGSASMPIPATALRNVTLAAKQFDGIVVAPGQELSFLQAVGEISPRAGYVSGLAIINNQLVETVGGGVCYVSTALYRAVLTAGLDVTARQSHSVMLAAFADQPGMDAAIETSGLDLRWRNDTGDDVSIVAQVQNGRLTITLWGTNDGRNVAIGTPVIGNRQPASTPKWIFDGALPGGSTRVMSSGAPGMDVRVDRVVQHADGSLLRRERVVTTYHPLPAITYFGPGVAPPSGVEVLGLDRPAPVSPERPWCGSHCKPGDA